MRVTALQQQQLLRNRLSNGLFPSTVLATPSGSSDAASHSRLGSGATALRTRPMAPCKGRTQRRMLGGPVKGFILDTDSDAMAFLADLLISPDNDIIDLEVASAAAYALGFESVIQVDIPDDLSKLMINTPTDAMVVAAEALAPITTTEEVVAAAAAAPAAAAVVAEAPPTPAPTPVPEPAAVVAEAPAPAPVLEATVDAPAAPPPAAAVVAESPAPLPTPEPAAEVATTVEAPQATLAAATEAPVPEPAAVVAAETPGPAPVEAPTQVEAPATEFAVAVDAPSVAIEAPPAVVDAPSAIVAAAPAPELADAAAAITSAPVDLSSIPDAAATVAMATPADALTSAADAAAPAAASAAQAVASAADAAAPAVASATDAAASAFNGAATNALAQLLNTSGLAESVHSLFGTLAAVSPAFLQPVLATMGADIEALVSFQPTMDGILRLLVLYYFTFSKPNPLAGVLDFYVIRNLFKKASNWRPQDFAVREKLGGGNFGTAFEAVNVSRGETVNVRVALTQNQKKRRVVLKRVNMEKGDEVRPNFLSAGTMAKGPGETGFVEDYMYNKIGRNPNASKCVAEYMGKFTSNDDDRTFVRGSQWLVWKYESDSTLSNALDGQLGEFPYCLEPFVLRGLGGNVGTMSPDKRAALVVKNIFKQVLIGLSRLHSIGIVHRDVKPENLLVTVDGKVKMIDFGAAVDMTTGVNFNPQYGMLDLRYAPPEELVMPKNFPRSPAPFIAALLAPLAWLYGAPNLFDSYSAGILLVQMSVPQLRNTRAARSLNYELSQVDYDLQRWRDMRSAKYDFSLLDRNNEAGWDLAKKLICKRNFLNRGRVSPEEALNHRYFKLD